MDVARTCMSMFAGLAVRGHCQRALHAGVLAYVNRREETSATRCASCGNGRHCGGRRRVPPCMNACCCLTAVHPMFYYSTVLWFG